jgi:hypothetical protein
MNNASGLLRVRHCHGLSLLIIATLAGCDFGGPAMYSVTGTVHFEGRPIPRGRISFIPEDSKERTASTQIEDGSYNVKMTAGSRKVQIMATRDNGPFDPVMGQAPQLQYIPNRYNINTELKANIAPDGENRFDYDLKGTDTTR